MKRHEGVRYITREQMQDLVAAGEFTDEMRRSVCLEGAPPNVALGMHPDSELRKRLQGALADQVTLEVSTHNIILPEEIDNYGLDDLIAELREHTVEKVRTRTLLNNCQITTHGVLEVSYEANLATVSITGKEVACELDISFLEHHFAEHLDRGGDTDELIVRATFTVHGNTVILRVTNPRAQ